MDKDYVWYLGRAVSLPPIAVRWPLSIAVADMLDNGQPLDRCLDIIQVTHYRTFDIEDPLPHPFPLLSTAMNLYLFCAFFLGLVPDIVKAAWTLTQAGTTGV
jgi:hypothetical protein